MLTDDGVHRGVGTGNDVDTLIVAAYRFCKPWFNGTGNNTSKAFQGLKRARLREVPQVSAADEKEFLGYMKTGIDTLPVTDNLVIPEVQPGHKLRCHFCGLRYDVGLLPHPSFWGGEVIEAFSIDAVFCFNDFDCSVAEVSCKLGLVCRSFCHNELHRQSIYKRIDSSILRWCHDPEMQDWYQGDDVVGQLQSTLVNPILLESDDNYGGEVR